MTSELEQEFFSVFGIEPKWKDKRVKSIKTYYTEEQAQYLRKTTKNRNIQLCYPDITAEKLLEMICMYNSTYTNGYTNYSLLNERNVEKLKEQILKNCLIVRDDIKHQIQQLFAEEE